MKRQHAFLLSAVMYFISLAAFVLLIGSDFTAARPSHIMKFITAFCVFVFGYAGALCRGRAYQDKAVAHRIMKRTLTLLFFAYTAVVLDFTLIDDSFGRNMSYIFTLDSALISEYISENTNLIPFGTVRLFIRGFAQGNVTAWAFVENLLGNFFVLMPYALLLPSAVKRMRTFGRFMLVIILFVLVIELLQLVFLTGSSDIDDVILNASGAALGFWILNRKRVGAALNAATFGVWNNEK